MRGGAHGWLRAGEAGPEPPAGHAVVLPRVPLPEVPLPRAPAGEIPCTPKTDQEAGSSPHTFPDQGRSVKVVCQ